MTAADKKRNAKRDQLRGRLVEIRHAIDVQRGLVEVAKMSITALEHEHDRTRAEYIEIGVRLARQMIASEVNTTKATKAKTTKAQRPKP